MTIYRFGRCQIDASERVLTMSGIALEVEPKVFNLLICLIKNSPNLLTKEELIERVWEGRVVSDSAISVAVNAARKVIGDSGRTQRYIKTVHKHGFRLVADIEALSVPTSPKELEFSRPVKYSVPTVAVVPGIVNVSSPAEFAYAFIDDIATELSRFHLLGVLSPCTSFDPAVRALDAKALSEKFCLDYVVRVSFEKSAEQYSIKATITDAKHRVIESLKERVAEQDLIKLRDECVSMLVSTVSSAISEQEV